jgi:hypothetical protein
MQAQGWFQRAHGFRKLGILEDACNPEVNTDLAANLAAAGIPPGQASVFVLDCDPSSGSSPPSQVEQAVVQHKLANVTNLMMASSQTNLDIYTNVAQQQGFHRRYSVSDYDGVIGHEGPVNAGQFDGALGITNDKTGEINSGLPFNAVSQYCNQVMVSHGLRPMVKEPDDEAVGQGCGMLLTFVAAATHAPSLTRTALLAGLDATGSLAEPFPFGDGLFSRPGKVAGGDFWRPAQWHASCTCWKVLDPTFRPVP